MTISYRFCLKNQRKHKFEIQFLKHMLGENIKCKPTIYRTVAITQKQFTFFKMGRNHERGIEEAVQTA